jgi:hypothetical protein
MAWRGVVLAALLLSLLSTATTPSFAREGAEPPDTDDDLHTPLSVEVSMNQLPPVNTTAEVTIVVSSTQPVSGVRVEVVGSDGMRIDGEREFVIDLTAGESRTLRTSATPELTGNHTVAANVSRDFGEGNVWGDSDAVHFTSGDGTASEGFTYLGDPLAGSAAPGPGNTMEFKSEAFPDGSMPALPHDEELVGPADTGDPGDARVDARAAEAAGVAGQLTILGNTGMVNRKGNWQPQRLLVELLRASNGFSIAQTYSDTNGNFTFTVANPGAFRIRVWAYYRHNSMNIGAIRVVGSGLQTFNRFTVAGWNYNTPAMGPFANGTVDVGSWTPAPNWEGRRAWWIYQDLYDAYAYTWHQVPPGQPAGSRQPDGVTAEWEPGSTDGTFYSIVERRIHLDDGDANSGHTVLHEYGHTVMHNLYDTFPVHNCPTPHRIEEPSGITCAWTEGWASFFALAIKADPIYTGGCTLPCIPGSVNFELRMSPTVGWANGELVEGNVAAVLWDFIDPYIDGYDKTNGLVAPFYEIWDIVYNHNHDSFVGFWYTWSAIVNVTNSLATLYENTIDYGWLNCPDATVEQDDHNLWADFYEITAGTGDDPYQRALCTEYDADWYILPVVPGSIYTIETMSLGVAPDGSKADTTLTLYRKDQWGYLNQLAHDDNGGSQWLSSRIEFTATTNDTHYVVVRHAQNRGDFKYRYSIDFTLTYANVVPTVTAPTYELTAGQGLINPSSNVYSVDVRASWTASDPDDGIASQSVQGQVDDAGFVMLAASLPATVRSQDVRMTIGTTNQLQVSATDAAGQSSGYATGESFDLAGAQETDFTYTGAWTNHAAMNAWGGSYVSTGGADDPSSFASSAGVAEAVAVYEFTGASAAVVGMTRADGGRADVYIDGVLMGSVDCYAPKAMDRHLLFAVNGLSDGAHVMEIRWINRHDEFSSGYQLYLDGAIALQ